MGKDYPKCSGKGIPQCPSPRKTISRFYPCPQPCLLPRLPASLSGMRISLHLLQSRWAADPHLSSVIPVHHLQVPDTGQQHQLWRVLELGIHLFTTRRGAKTQNMGAGGSCPPADPDVIQPSSLLAPYPQLTKGPHIPHARSTYSTGGHFRSENYFLSQQLLLWKHQLQQIFVFTKTAVCSV